MRKSSFSRALSLVMHVLLATVLALGAGLVATGVAYAKTDAGETVLVAGSDFQSNWPDDVDGSIAQSATNVTDLLTAIRDVGGYRTVDGMLYGGDYTCKYNVTKEQSEAGIAALKAAASGVYPELDDSNMILIQGNHETASGIAGLAVSGKNDRAEYGVFVVNEDDFMWRSYLTQEGLTEEQATAKEQQTATNLMNYLNAKIEVGYTKPIFVLLHVPLHYSGQTSGSGDGRNANYLFNVLNKGAKAGLNIICMFGHNHGWSRYEDFHGGGSVYLKPGDKINIAQNSKTDYKRETLAFTYLNYGYTGYVGSNVDPELTMTVFVITDSSVTVKRYDKTSYWDSSGEHKGKLHNMKTAGSSTSSGALAADTNVYESPQTIALNTQIDTSKLIDNYLSEEATDEEIAQVVIEQIAALPATESLTLADKPAVEAARAAYDALTDVQKVLVTNLATLEAAEDRIAALGEVQDISGADVTLSQTSYTYTGTAYEPKVTVTVGSSTLVVDTDYTVSYANNTNAGTATVTITGKGSYSGTATAEFTIAKAQVVVPAAAAGFIYTGSEQTGVEAGEGYTLSGTCSATNAGSYVATATLSDTANHEWAGGSTDPKGMTWSIAPVDASSATIDEILDQVYTGSALTPSVVVRLGDEVIASDNYDVAFANNTAIGTASVTVTFKGNYTGGITGSFSIVAPSKEALEAALKAAANAMKDVKTSEDGSGLQPGDVYVTPAAQRALGGAVSAAQAVYDDDGATTEGIAGATAALNGAIEDYEKAKRTVEEPAFITVDVPKAATGLVYDGSEQTGVEAGEGYALSGTCSATDAGSYEAKATLKDGYAWTNGSTEAQTIEWSIAKADAVVTEAPAAVAGLTYTGKAQALVSAGSATGGELRYSLDGKTYSESLPAGTNAGAYTAYYRVVGDANHNDVAASSLKVTIAKAKVAVPTGRTLTYSGSRQTGVTAGARYTLNGHTGTAAGSYTATATLSDTANYRWADGQGGAERKVAWKINAASVKRLTVASIAGKVFTGSAIKPTPTVRFGSVTLTRGVDYALGYEKNVNAGTATVTLRGMGNFAGERKVTFKILKAASTIKLADQTKDYTGKAQAYSGKVTKTGSSGKVTFKYYSDAKCTKEVKAENVRSVGIYYVRATLAADANHRAATSAAAKLTIKAAGTWQRYGGATALDTGKLVVEADGAFAKGRGGTVVVATSGGYWDALAAAGLAGTCDAPVLITPKDSLASQTAAEIKRLAPSRVLVMGGPAAVSDATVGSIKSIVPNTRRVYGSNAPETAVSIYQAGSGWGRTAVIATSKGYWDALSIAPYAWAAKAPIFLTKGTDDIPDSALKAIKGGGFTRVVIVGGTAAVEPSVANKVRAATGIAPTRLAGRNALATSGAIAAWEIKQGMGLSHMAVATSKGYWDALTAAAVCGKQNSVLVLVDPSGVYDAFDAVYDRAQLVHGHVLGGEGALPRAVWDYVNKA